MYLQLLLKNKKKQFACFREGEEYIRVENCALKLKNKIKKKEKKKAYNFLF